MTREEAIKRLEEIQFNTHTFEDEKAMEIAIRALRPVSREQVEKVWRGEWVKETTPELLKGSDISHCSRCWHHVYRPDAHTRFCKNCGAPMTDEAVQMVMERLEALHENIHND